MFENSSTGSSGLPAKECPAQIGDVAGIVELGAYGAIDVCDDGEVFGSVVLIGALVAVVPRHGLAAWQHAVLMAAADRVWVHGRGDGGGWRFDREFGGWVTGILFRYPDSPESSRAASSAITWGPSPAWCALDSVTFVTAAGCPSGL